MPKRPIPTLVGDRVRLRPLREEDLASTLTWRNQDRVRRWFLHSEVITPAQHRQWFEEYVERDDDFVFLIEETRELRKPVGQVALYRIDWAGRRAEYGRLMIGEAGATGRGLGREATNVLVEYAIGPLGLREIELTVLADNAPAIAIYRGCGFRQEERDGDIVRMVRRA
jgi:RimJ/RimL family protein N-acetyltransferase